MDLSTINGGISVEMFLAIESLLTEIKGKKDLGDDQGEPGMVCFKFSNTRLSNIFFIHHDFDYDVILDVFNITIRGNEDLLSGYSYKPSGKVNFEKRDAFLIEFIEHNDGGYVDDEESVKTNLIKLHYDEPCYFYEYLVNEEKHFFPCGYNVFLEMIEGIRGNGGDLITRNGICQCPENIRVTAPFLMSGTVKTKFEIKLINK